MRATGGAGWWENAAVLAPACFVFAFACLSPWPICRVRPLQLADAAALVGTWATAAAAAGGLFAAVAWGFARLEGQRFPHLDLLAGTGALLYLLSAGLHYAALASQASREAALAMAEAQTLARDAELHALRMQVNPHFLFNSLHSISALAVSDGASAREMCIRLAEFLRLSLAVEARQSVPLREELALARSYLAVEQVRFGSRLHYFETIDEASLACPIPVLLLQPLVENAVKHGIAGLVEGGTIRLVVDHAAESVRVLVENAFDPEAAPPARLGIGLNQVRRRLELRYGSAAALQTGTRDGIYFAEFRFPCDLAHPQDSEPGAEGTP